MMFFLSIRIGDSRTLAPRTTQVASWIERLTEMDGHLCRGAVNKYTAMSTKPSVDVHRRIRTVAQRNFSLKFCFRTDKM